MCLLSKTYSAKLLAAITTSLLLCAVGSQAFAQGTGARTEVIPTPADQEIDLFEDSTSSIGSVDEEIEHHGVTEQYYDASEHYDNGPRRHRRCGSRVGCGYPVSRRCRPTGYWVDAGYVMYWTKSVDMPVLATTSPVGTDPNVAGVLGEATTSVVFGGSSLLGDMRGGGQFEVGMWLDPAETASLEINYLFLGEKNDDFVGSQDNFAILARPFFRVDTGEQDARLIVLDNITEGTLRIATETSLHTSALAYRNMLLKSRNWKLDYLVGYRFAYLGDTVQINESTLGLPGSDAPGNEIDLLDLFDSTNYFHGGEFGFELQRRMDRIWSCSLSARVALGGSLSETTIFGRTSVDDGTSVTTTQGGLLTQPTNIGNFRDTEFNTVSNFAISLRRKLFTHTTLTFGYNFLLWSHVYRAADQIDTNVNTTQIQGGTLDGAALPAFPGVATSYWAHGINFNVEGKF